MEVLHQLMPGELYLRVAETLLQLSSRLMKKDSHFGDLMPQVFSPDCWEKWVH